MIEQRGNSDVLVDSTSSNWQSQSLAGMILGRAGDSAVRAPSGDEIERASTGLLLRMEQW